VTSDDSENEDQNNSGDPSKSASLKVSIMTLVLKMFTHSHGLSLILKACERQFSPGKDFDFTMNRFGSLK